MDDQAQQDSGFVYPERQARIQSEELKNRRIAAQQWITKAVAANPDHAGLIEARYGAMFKELMPEVKTFDESLAAKDIMSQQPAMIRIDRMIGNIYREISAASKIEDVTAKIDRLQTIIPKLIQSTASGGSDAMQMGEFLLGAPELNNFTRWAAANGKPLSASSLVSYFADPAIPNKIIGVDPDAYIKKVMGVHDSIASSRNDDLYKFERQSSPEWVAKNTGLKRLPLFGETAPVKQAAQQPVQQKQIYTTIELAKRALSDPAANEEHKAAAKSILGIK